MAKSSTIFLCSSCGNEFTKWTGQCPGCKSWNTLSEIKLSSFTPNKNRSTSVPKTLTPQEARTSATKLTTKTTLSELDRVLGPGLTSGGVYLLAGQPGIGKSTLLSQLSLKLASPKHPILYICSEENAAQVATRLSRLDTKKNNSIHLLETSITEDILSTMNKLKPSLVIVDSIQSVGSSELGTTPGTMTQIRASSNLLISAAKSTGIPTILVGHVTKQGKLAGPKLLEHMVDVVLEIEGDRHHDLRLLRGLKNRFGPTDETGLFQMTSSGLEAVDNPGKLFLNEDSTNQPGSALTLIMEGTRPLLVEIQALTVPTELAIPRRVAQGIPINKLQLISAVLTKHANLKLGTKDVFVNITGGLRVTDPAADLAIALAIISSAKNKALPKGSLAIGELGLLGEIRPVSYLDKRLKEAKTLGYNAAFTPSTTKTIRSLNLA